MGRDVGVAEAIRETFPESLRGLFETLTHLGDWRFAIAALAILVAADLLSGLRSAETDDTPLFTSTVLIIVATVFGALALVLVLETVIDAPLPETVPPTEPPATGFPSGHATVAAVFWGSLATWLRVSTRRIRVSVAAVVITLVAVSRLVLGMHFLIDVFGGVFLGVGYVAIVVAVLDSRPDRAFAFALALSALAVVLVGTDRAMLSLAGTLGTVLGWHLLEWPPVRTRLRAGVAAIR